MQIWKLPYIIAFTQKQHPENSAFLFPRCFNVIFLKYHFLNEYRSSCQIETSPLICSANQWTRFCIIGTSAIKDSRRSLSTYTESLFLHVVKHNLLFFVFIFLSGFSVTNIHDSQDSRLRGRLSPYILSTSSTRFTETWILPGLLLQRAHLSA